MANKYHISPTTGRPNICTASVKDCPVGGSHYDSKDDARKGFEKEMTKSTIPDKLSKGSESLVKNGVPNDDKIWDKAFQEVSERHFGRPMSSHELDNYEDEVYDEMDNIKAQLIEDGLMESERPEESNVVSINAKKEKLEGDLITLRASTDFDEGWKNMRKGNLSKADIKMVEDVAAGKKISDEKLDIFLEDHKHAEKLDAYEREEDVKNAQKVFAYLRAVRASSGTASTLPTLETFDPATQTLFSNANARSNAAVAGKAIRREAAHAEWMHELAGENEASALDYAKDGDKDTAAKYRQTAANNREDALKSEARVQAQLRELQHLYDTDSSFHANPEIKRALSKGWFRPQANSFDDIYIGSVKKLKK